MPLQLMKCRFTVRAGLISMTGYHMPFQAQKHFRKKHLGGCKKCSRFSLCDFKLQNKAGFPREFNKSLIGYNFGKVWLWTAIWIQQKFSISKSKVQYKYNIALLSTSVVQILSTQNCGTNPTSRKFLAMVQILSFCCFRLNFLILFGTCLSSITVDSYTPGMILLFICKKSIATRALNMDCEYWIGAVLAWCVLQH